jgi:hypothetical protein
MTDCTHYRRAILADPRDADPTLATHRESCPECRAYTERLLRFERRLEHALRVSPPAQGTLWGMRRGWLAMAASVLIVLLVAASLWLAAPHPSLAADVVAHMAGEPQAWARTEVPVPPAELTLVLRDAHMRLSPDAGTVSYASSCRFRGRMVPHLVVQTEMGPITVMVLVHESVTKPVAFEEQGYSGVILPMPGHGSLAVLGRGKDADLNAVEEIAARVQRAIVWTG